MINHAQIHRFATTLLLSTVPCSLAISQEKISVDPPTLSPASKETEPNEMPIAIDLATALRLAGSQNPELMIARERMTEAMANRQLAAAQALPNINAGLNYDLHRGPLQQSNGNILKVNRDAMYVGLGANAVAAGSVNIPGVNYNLNVGTAWFNYLQSKQQLQRNTAAIRTAQNQILLRVSLAHTNLVKSEAKLAILKKNYAEASEIARLTTVYANAGQGRKADADRANVELRKREADIIQAEADATAASARLAKLLNLNPSTRLKPAEGSAIPSSIIPEPITLQELVATALMQRPELEERRAEVKESLYALSSARLLPFSPNVILGFSTGAFGGGSNRISQDPGFIGADGRRQIGPRFGNFDDRVDFDAVVYFSVQNLGFGNAAQTRAAGSRARQVDLKQQESLNRIRMEVVEADSRSKAKLKQIDTLEKALSSSEEAFEQDLKRIKAREGLPIEVMDSVRLLGRARLEYLDAISEYNTSQFELFVAIGQPPADALARPIPSTSKFEDKSKKSK